MSRMVATVALFVLIGVRPTTSLAVQHRPARQWKDVHQTARLTASAPSTNNDPALDTFVRDYYRAATQHDVTKRRSLVHPQYLACIDAVSGAYFEQELSLFPRNVTTSGLVSKALTPSEARASAAVIGARLPLDADHFLAIDWKETSGSETTNHPSMIALRRENGRYLEVISCPSAADIQKRNAFFERVKKPGLHQRDPLRRTAPPYRALRLIRPRGRFSYAA
jgi:hypothetical protein